MDLLRSLPIGLYLEQPITWLHRLDPRVKLIWLISILIAPILANGLWRCIVVGLLILVTLTALIPLRVWRQQMGWLLILCLLVFIVTMTAPDGLGITTQPRLPTPGNTLVLPNPLDVQPLAPQPTDYQYILFQQGPLTVNQRSLELAVRISTLLFTLIYGTNLFLLTTSPEEITAALENLMGPLRWFKIPVTEITLTLTLALRFIPLVLEEIQNLVRSVRTRAINWKKLGLRQAAQIWMMIAERLLENLLLRAEQIAGAMHVRGFTTPDQHRVEWYHFRFRIMDWLAFAGLAVFWWARFTWGGDF